MHYPHRLVSISLQHQAHAADPQAVVIVVTVHGKGFYSIGYVPRSLAQAIAPLLDADQTLAATFKTVTDSGEIGHYGLRLTVRVASGRIVYESTGYRHAKRFQPHRGYLLLRKDTTVTRGLR